MRWWRCRIVGGASSSMVPSNWLVGPSRVIIKRFMIVQSEHLRLLMILTLWLWTRFGLIERLLLTIWLSWCFVTTCRLIVFLVEKGEVVRILALTVARIVVGCLLLFSKLAFLVLSRNREMGWDLFRCLRWFGRCVLLARRVYQATFLGSYHHRLFVTYALVTLVTIENSIPRIRVVVVVVAAILIVVDGVARSVFCTDSIIVSEGCSGWSDSTQTRIVTSSALQNSVR